MNSLKVKVKQIKSVRNDNKTIAHDIAQGRIAGWALKSGIHILNIYIKAYNMCINNLFCLIL